MIGLVLPLGILLAAGLATIASISPHLFVLQLVWILAGVLVVAAFLFFDLGTFLNQRWLAWGLYVLSVVLLAAALRGPAIRNIHSWIILGPVTFQPLELAKVALILLLAHYFSRRHLGIARWSVIFGSFALFAVPGILVLIEPDLGSALILAAIWFGFLLLAGLPLRRLLVGLAVFLLLAVFGWSHVLKDYQRARIEGVLYPEKYALSINYGTNQSKIAIGSAGFWGKGYKQGGQTALGFLTEPEGDYVLAAFIEQWGVFGGLVVVAALVALVIWILRVGLRADQNFEKFVCLGTATMFIAQFFMNAGSVVGLLPTVGLTLPFVSYGGSSIVMNFSLLAVVNSIRRRL